MRWIALGLLLANLIYGLVLLQRAPVTGTAVPQPKPAGERLLLLSERSAVAGGAQTAAPVELAPVEVPAPPIPICEMLGPLPDEQAARNLRDRLQADGAAAGAYRMAVPTRTDYWVHVGPLPTRREALELLRELQQRQIDSFIITEGELTNSVSLGYFTREASAAQAMTERRAQGYDANVRAIPRYTDQFWVVAEQAIALGGLRLPEGAGHRKNFCDAIASAVKFE